MATGPTRRKGHAQRDLAYHLIRSERLSGVVYNMDDDNAYAPQLWDELRTLQRGRVGVLPVKLDIQNHYSERPVYDSAGRFDGFIAGWCANSRPAFGPRLFCIDMGAFAFDAALLGAAHLAGSPLWSYHGRSVVRRRQRKVSRVEWRGGETEFVQRLLPALLPEDLQPLANCAHDVLVFHNGFNATDAGGTAWAPSLRPRVYCKDDGW